MDNSSKEKPCLVPTEQGFSVLYQNRYLYSKYNPSAAAQKTVASLEIAPQTLVLVFSPVLAYALQELIQKLPDDCYILLVEQDKNLYDFSLPYIAPLAEKCTRLISCCPANLSDFTKLFAPFTGKLSPSNFRRCIFLELSGGAKLNEIFYKTVIQSVDIILNQFWRNRITLVHLGRLYARNIMRNIGRLPSSKVFVPKSTARPILVCGSGCSLDEVIPRIKNDADQLFVIAVDNALMPLLKQGIIPDAVIAVESQLANEKAFMGAVKTGIPLIADLTSRPHILSLTGGEVSFFLTEYEHLHWLKRVQKALNFNAIMRPLGSVGLSAMDLALSLRADAEIPIFFCGLDFSFIPAKTHCKESPAHRARLDTHTRLNPLEVGESTFVSGTSRVAGKDGVMLVTTPSLAGYGKSFSSRYTLFKNIFDISPIGMINGCNRATVNEMLAFLKNFSSSFYEDKAGSKAEEQSWHCNKDCVRAFYNAEEEKLLRIKELLVNGAHANKDELLSLIAECEYLYVHFADGYKKPSLDLSFLNRVRGEIDFFIKDINIGRSSCQ